MVLPCGTLPGHGSVASIEMQGYWTGDVLPGSSDKRSNKELYADKHTLWEGPFSSATTNLSSADSSGSASLTSRVGWLSVVANVYTVTCGCFPGFPPLGGLKCYPSISLTPRNACLSCLQTWPCVSPSPWRSRAPSVFSAC